MDLSTMAAVGAAVRAARREQGLTQAQLARRMGVTQAWVSRLEAGGTRLAAQLVLDAFVALGTPLSVTPAARTARVGRVVEQDVARPLETKTVVPEPEDDDDPFADVRRRVDEG